MVSCTIVLVPHDPRWQTAFEREKRRIQVTLGAAALSVEHVGSTAVENLHAKPVIDIVLMVEDSSREETYKQALEDLGFALIHREPDWFEHRMFQRHDPPVNLHIFSRDCTEAARMVRFRDWLRASTSDRLLYEQAKLKLAQREWNTIQDYATAKGEVVNDIMSRLAREMGA